MLGVGASRALGLAARRTLPAVLGLALTACRPLRQADRSGLELHLPFQGGGADFSGHGRMPSYVNGQLQAPGGL